MTHKVYNLRTLFGMFNQKFEKTINALYYALKYDAT